MTVNGEVENFLTNRERMKGARRIYHDAYVSAMERGEAKPKIHARTLMTRAFPVVEDIFKIPGSPYSEPDAAYSEDVQQAARDFVASIGACVRGLASKKQRAKILPTPSFEWPSNANSTKTTLKDKLVDWFNEYDFCPGPEMVDAFQGIHGPSVSSTLSKLREDGYTIEWDRDRKIYHCITRPMVITEVSIDDDEEKIFTFLKARFPGRF